jgi:regulator of RNase E activity RraA
MTTRSQYLGSLGTIINGNVRDVAEHQQAQYPIFSKGVGTCSPNGVAFCSAVGQEIEVGETGGSVRTGDVLVGDLNGVVCIPRDLVQAVVDMVPGLVKVDEAIMERVKQGVSVYEAFKARKA